MPSLATAPPRTSRPSPVRTAAGAAAASAVASALLAACTAVVPEELGGAAASVTAETCAPERGDGVVSRFQRALHDSIAWAEGTEGYSKDGYDVAFTFHVFSSCVGHPRRVHCQGGLCSSASGRYQFLTGTWDRVARALDLPNFEPESQELAAQYLVRRVRRVNVPDTRGLSAAEFSGAMRKLSYEWASLPPGRYGQPTKTERQMWTDYSANLVTSGGAPRPDAAAADAARDGGGERDGAPDAR